MAGERTLKLTIAGDASGAVRAIRQTEGSLGKLGGLGKLAGIGLAAGAAAAVTGLGLSVKAAADVEQQLNILKQVSGATGAEMKSLGGLAKELGADITLPGTSSKDAAEAMTELAKAGLSVNDVMGASKGVLQLSAAGQLSNANAAEIAANALNAFGLAGSEATRVADLLAAAANASSVEVFDVGDSLKMVGAVAASAGVPIETVVTAISQLGNAGVKGSDAGTSLKQMLLSLQNPSEKAAGVMEDLGFKVYDAAGAMLPFEQIIANLQTSTAGLTQQQRDQALATIFGSDAVRAANILLKEGVEGHDRMKEAVTQQGAAADLAAAQNKGLNGAIDGLKSAVETLMISAGTPLLGFLTTLALAAAGAVGQVEPLMHLFQLGFDGGAIGGQFSAVETAMFNAGAKARELVEWLDKVLPSAETVRGIGADVFDGLKTGAEGVSGAATNIAARLNEVLTLAQEGDWAGAGKAMGEGLLDGLGAIAGGGQKLGKALVEAMQDVEWATVGREAAEAAIPFVAGFVEALLDPTVWIEAMLENWEITLSLVLAVVFAPGKLVAGFANALRRIPFAGRFAAWLIEEVHDAGRKAVDPILGYLGDFVSLMWRGFLGRFDSEGGQLLPRLRGIVTRAVDGVRDLGETFALRGLEFAERLGGAIADHGPVQVVNGLRRAINAVDDVVGWAAGKMRALGGDMVEGLISGIRGLAGRVAGAARDLAGDAINAAKERLKVWSPSRVFVEIGQNVGEGLALGIEATTGRVQGAARHVLEQMAREFNDLPDEVRIARADFARELGRAGGWTVFEDFSIAHRGTAAFTGLPPAFALPALGTQASLRDTGAAVERLRALDTSRIAGGGEASVAAYDELLLQLSATREGFKRQILETTMALDDLTVAGKKGTPEFEALEAKLQGLQDAVKRIDLIEDFKLEPFRGEVDKVRKSMQEAAKAAEAAAEASAKAAAAEYERAAALAIAEKIFMAKGGLARWPGQRADDARRAAAERLDMLREELALMGSWENSPTTPESERENERRLELMRELGLIQQSGPVRSENYGQITNVFPGVTTADEVVKVQGLAAA